jgi:hypothetical protein
MFSTKKRKTKRYLNMKKINPKVIGLVAVLLSFLIAGSLSVQVGRGDPILTPDPPENDGGG